MTSLPSIIKAQQRGGFSRPTGSMVVEPLFSSFVEEPAAPTPEEIAARIVGDARIEAERLIAEASAEAGRIREEARQEGLALGEQEAEGVWRARMTELDEQASTLLREQEEFYVSAEPELASLSVEIARKILKQEIAQNPEAVLKVVRSAIHRVKDKEVRVLVNPTDLETVRGARESLQGVADGATDIEIVSDRRVGPGGCVLETPGGSVDARIETQLTHIAEVIGRESDDKADAPNAES